MIKQSFLTIAILFIFITQLAYSQLNYLKTGTSNIAGTYTDLGTNGTPITTANFDNANSAPQNIGFTFNYNGIAFTQFVLNTNGFIKLGNTNPSIDSLFFAPNGNTTTGGVFNSTNPADTNIICVFNHDLQAGTGTPEYRVYTNGTAGSRVCTIQFKNVRDKTATPVIQYDNMEFQIKLYEMTNTIEFIYGVWIGAATGTSTLKTAAVGLKGTNKPFSELLVVSKTSGQNWSAGKFDTINYGSTAFNFKKSISPDAGRTFRFLQALPNDAAVNLFTLGSIPNPYGAPRIDSAIVRNIGMKTLTNIAVTLTVSGANTFTDTKNIPSLAPGASVTIGFAPYTNTFSGTNLVAVNISPDDNTGNDISTYSQLVNNTVFSYADSGPVTGRLGGLMPSYFVTKYTITGTTSVTGASIFITGNATIGKTVYAILFDNASAKLDSSAALVITPADTGKYYNFLFLTTPTINNSSFYVGLAQPTTGVNYYPLGYQSELPVRFGAYFISTILNAPDFTNPAKSTDFGGVNSSNPYRLMIQALITNTTGILTDEGQHTITVYPNPFNNTATFKIPAVNGTGVSFILYDVTGKAVKTMENITTSEFNFERENLQSGMYFYTINSAERLIDSGKLIIE